jgi:hypothetical protein
MEKTLTKVLSQPVPLRCRIKFSITIEANFLVTQNLVQVSLVVGLGLLLMDFRKYGKGCIDKGDGNLVCFLKGSLW